MMPVHPTPWAEMLFHVPALAVAKLVVSSWTWLYTLASPRNERVARRAETLSDVHDQMAQGREEGIGPIKMTLNILARMMLGSLDDVMWAGRYVPSALDGHLRRGSDAIANVRPSPLAISSLAMLGLMNWTLVMSGLAHPWFEWVVVNAAVLTVAPLLLRQRHPRVRGPSRAWSTSAAVLAIGLATWMVLGSHLEQVLIAPQFAFDAAFTVLLVVSGTLAAAARICRVHVSWGAWWPVWLCWATLGVVAWGTAVPAGEGLRGLAELSLVTALVCMGWMALAATLAFACRAACYGGQMGSARCMWWLAAGIRMGER